MDLKQLKYFLAVAEERSFSRAAERLHISQPPLSQQIMKLESELGLKLFARTTRNFELTVAGKALVTEARAVLAHMNLAINTVKQIDRGDVGRLRIGIIGSAMWGPLPKLLEEFRRSYPRVSWTLHELDPNAQHEALRMRQIDVGFWRVPMTDPALLEQDHLCQELFFRENFQVALHQQHPLAKRRKLSFADLAEESILTLKPERSTSARYLIQCFADAGFIPHITHQLEEPQTMLALVGAGLGVAFAPQSTGRINWPGVVFVPIADKPPAADICVAHRLDDDTPVVRAFLNVLRELIH